VIGLPRPLLALRTLRSQSRRTRSELENFRDRQIRELVAHAYANVPFYRRLYDTHGISPGKVRGFGDLPMLPLATRSELQRAAESDLVARGIDPRTLRIRRTNGTTGEPLSVRRTSAESALLRLYYFQAFRSLGVRRTDLSVGIRLPRPGSAHPSVNLPRQIANRAGLYARVTLVAENPMRLLEALKRLSPAILGGVPGLLSTIAARWPAEAREEIRSANWPRLVVTGGERLTPSVRTHLRDVFGARVLDMYSSHEFNLIASECPATGSYHVSDETVALEVLDGTRAAMPGETGQPVGTALHSFAAPLIRYALGDLVTMGTTQCDCGVPHSTIREIQGRIMHYLELPDGMIVHHNKIEEAVGYAAGWVRQTQVSRPRIDLLVLRLAPLRDPSAEEIDHVRTSVEAYLHHHVTVEIVIDPELGPEDGEKFRPLIPLPATT
jgi:phenylacetate-CoA ligase